MKQIIKKLWMLALPMLLGMTGCSNDDNSAPDSGRQNQWGTEELTVTVSGIDMKLKLVKGGAYSMQYERDDQTKTVTGTLSDYYMASVEVTNKLWAAVMGAKPEGQINDGDMYPVTMVNYYDIVGPNGFLEKLSAMVKDQLPEGTKFQLPTEARWQYAAMGGQKSKGYTYAGSNTLSDVAWYADNAKGTTHPVASKQPNELGLYDMSGNVWERCSDWYVDLDDLPAEQGLDYAGPATSDRLVGRGGCFENAPTLCTVGYHGREIIGLQQAPTTTVGFRLMLADVNGLAEKVTGKWLLVDSEGQPVVTDRVSVYTFAKEGSGLKAYFSMAMAESQTWLFKQQADVTVGTGSLTLTSRLDNGSTAVVQMTDVSVSGSDLTFTAKTTISTDGVETATYGPRREHFTSVSADYKAEDIIGTWDGYYSCNDPEYSKPDPHRAVFRADGTCNYYYAKDGNEFKVDPTVYSKYFVDGSLLSLCWLDYGDGQREQYENWEILSISKEKIISRAFHKHPDGTIYTETYHLSKVD